MADRSERTVERLTVSEGALLSPSVAAELLGFRGARAWLEREGLVCRLGVGGREVRRVVWRQVLARLEQGDEPAPKTRRRGREYRLADV